MTDGVDGKDLPGNEPTGPDTPVPATPPDATEPAAAAQPPAPEPPAAVPPALPPAAAFPSGYPHWAPPPSPPTGPAGAPPQTPQPAAPAGYPGVYQDPWTLAPTGGYPPPPYPPNSPPAWTPAWPPAPASTPPPHRHASRRTAAIAAMLLFAAAAGASAGVVALTTRGSSPSTTTSSTSPLGSGSSAPLPTASSSPTGAPLTQAQIEAKVDPAIVDVTVTLAGGTAQGTGMVITSTGEILTNNHVIDGATAIKVTIGGTGTTYAANVVGYDVADDIAVLQISSSVSGLSTISVGNPAQLAVGDTVLALGNALGRGGTPTPAAGTITGLGRTITAGDSSGNSETLTNLIEVNARIQPGDSGGPLVNQYGQVIGMDTAASVSGGRFRNITGTGQGYAIPIDTALTIVQQIRNGGGGNPNIQVGPRALLGVQINGTSGGATVVGTQAGGPAAGLGIVAGDVITSVGGVQVDSSQSLQAAILKHKPGDKVTVTWTDQAGTQHSGTATLVPGPPA